MAQICYKNKNIYNVEVTRSFSDDSKHAKAEKDRIAYPVMDECERTVGVAQLNKRFYFCAITVDSFYRHNLV